MAKLKYRNKRAILYTKLQASEGGGKVMKNIWYFIKHSFTGCQEEDLIYVNKSSQRCTKCGRNIFIFKI